MPLMRTCRDYTTSSAALGSGQCGCLGHSRPYPHAICRKTTGSKGAHHTHWPSFRLDHRPPGLDPGKPPLARHHPQWVPAGTGAALA
jgi:hypothetical protein